MQQYSISFMLIVILAKLSLSESAELLFVVEMVRHGARSEVKDLSFYEDIKWPEGPGQLTPTGMRQQYLLGEDMRRSYIEDVSLLSSAYKSEEVYVRSTNVNRTIMSAYSQLMGLFPESAERTPKHNYSELSPIKLTMGEEISENGIPYEEDVYPIHVYDTEYDRLLVWDNSCPEYRRVRREIVNGGDIYNIYKGIKEEYGDVLESICDLLHIDKTIANIGENTILLLDDLVAAHFEGILPKVINDTLLGDIRAFHYALFKEEMIGDPLLVTVAMTGISKYLAHVFSERITNSNSQLRFILLSTHDSVLEPILAGMDHIPPSHPPYMPFAANIIFQLYRQQNNYFVRVKYNGKYFLNMTLQQFNTFMGKRAAKSWEDWENICKLSSNSRLFTWGEIKISASGMLTITGLIFMLLAFYLFKNSFLNVLALQRKEYEIDYDQENIDREDSQPFLS